MVTLKGMPKQIWILGFVSLFMDISSEIVHSLLPVFLVGAMGASYTSVGLVEGLGEGMALLFKTISGPLSDRLKKRRLLVLIGYGMGAPQLLVAAAASTGVATVGGIS